MPGRVAVRIDLDEPQHAELTARARRRRSLRADAQRTQIVLLAARGLTNLTIAREPGVTRVTVAVWRQRFASRGLEELSDEPRPGAPRRIGDEKITEMVTVTLETMPAAATHWSTRSMARASGLSVSTVHRIWRAFSSQPHRSETSRLSTNPLVVEKVRDIVGLSLDPPHQALVLCVEPRGSPDVLDDLALDGGDQLGREPTGGDPGHAGGLLDDVGQEALGHAGVDTCTGACGQDHVELH